NEENSDNKNEQSDNNEIIDNTCQLQQINGKKKKPNQLNGTPATTEDGNLLVSRSLSYSNGDRNNDFVSESSRIPISKRVMIRKTSKNIELGGNRKLSIPLKSRQVKLYRNLSSKSKLFATTFRRVPDSSSGSVPSSDSELESHYMNGNSAIQFYKYPLRSRSGRLSISRRLECAAVSKRKVSLRSSDARISEDIDSRKKIRFDEDSYSSEEEILCSGQVFTCSPITPIITHAQKSDAQKSDANIDNLQVSPIPKPINGKNVDKQVSNSIPQNTISSPTNVNVNMNGSQELAQKPSNDSNLGTTTANDASSSSKRQTDHHYSIQNSKTSIATSTNQCVNINVNTQSSESLQLIAPKP
ncbi:31893_t:CDS:1, partial [Racocetra persica]